MSNIYIYIYLYIHFMGKDMVLDFKISGEIEVDMLPLDLISFQGDIHPIPKW